MNYMNGIFLLKCLPAFFMGTKSLWETLLLGFPKAFLKNRKKLKKPLTDVRGYGNLIELSEINVSETQKNQKDFRK